MKINILQHKGGLPDGQTPYVKSDISHIEQAVQPAVRLPQYAPAPCKWRLNSHPELTALMSL